MTDDIGPVARVFAQLVPEIGSGAIEIKAIARKAGYRSMVALQSLDASLDCLDTVLGRRGHLIEKIVGALGGERIALIRWNDSPELFISNALQPAVVARVILHPEDHRAVVVVNPAEMAMALGRRGENQQLVTELSGWQIEFEDL